MRTIALASFALLALAATARGQVSCPMLMGVRPTAVQIGTTSEVEVVSRYPLSNAYQVIVHGAGVTGEIVPPPPVDGQPATPADAVKVRFAVAADALPGVRDFRLVTPLGATTVGQLVLTADPVVVEANPNDTLETAQAVALPAALCGALEKAEDVDYYKFTAAAGQSLTFHVRSARLQNRLHDFQTQTDPIITLRNAAGTVLAMADNYFFADPLLHYTFSTAGDYLLEIRDLRYQGNGFWHYSVEVSDRPFAIGAFPLAVAPGGESRLAPFGHGLAIDSAALAAVPADAADGIRWALPLLEGGASAGPVPLFVTRLPIATELESENGAPAAAQSVGVPSAVNGRIESPGDIDCFSFEAKAGERLSFEVVARRCQSALDANLRILDAAGGVLAENDDLNTGRFLSADSWIENWAAPADGRYFLEVRDLHLRGGVEAVYCLTATRAEPYFTLEIDTDKTLLQPGLGGAIFVRVFRRSGFAGEIQLSLEGLPAGVTATCGRILADASDGCIVLSTAADAPRGAANVRILGTAVVPPAVPPGDAAIDPAAAGAAAVTLIAEAKPLQEIYVPGGGRANYPVEMHTVSVGQGLDLTAVRINTSRVTLKPGESQRIEVEIVRREGFDKNVTLDCVFQHLGTQFGNSLPKGVTIDEAASQTLLAGGQSQGFITLVAAADAPPVVDQQTCVMANVSVNFVMKMTHSSEPLYVTVAPAD